VTFAACIAPITHCTLDRTLIWDVPGNDSKTFHPWHHIEDKHRLRDGPVPLFRHHATGNGGRVVLA